MRLIFAGSGEFGLPTLNALLQNKHDLVQIFTQPDRPAGRGRKLMPTAIGQFALEKSLPLSRTANINAEPLPPADAMIVIAFGQKIAPPAVNHPRLGSVNLHASRLPQYRGAAPVNWPILDGQTITGNSVIRLASKMDAGAILGQSELTIDPLETAGELHDRLAQDGVALILKVLDDLQRGTAHELAQDESAATAARKLSRDDARIDWNSPAAQISRRIRGLYPWPGCRLRLMDAARQELDRFTLVRASVTQGEGPRWNPGEITFTGAVTAAQGDEALDIIELQPEGKRPMPLADYRRGHSWMPGMRLESI